MGIFPERAEKEERSKSMTQNLVKVDRMSQIITTLYWSASEITLGDFKERALRDFESRVITLYNKAEQFKEGIKFDSDVTPEYLDKYNRGCELTSKSLYSTAFYDTFKFAGNYFNDLFTFPIYNFNINPKNINFYTYVLDVKDHFDRCTYYPQEVCCNPKPKIVILKDIPNWKDLFGKGEFPNITIYVFRLGNTEYYAYTIGR